MHRNYTSVIIIPFESLSLIKRHIFVGDWPRFTLQIKANEQWGSFLMPTPTDTWNLRF